MSNQTSSNIQSASATQSATSKEGQMTQSSSANTTCFVSYFNVKEVASRTKATTHTLTLGSVRESESYGSFAAFSISSDNGPATNHFVMVDGVEVALNVQALADFMGMQPGELQFKFNCEDYSDQIQEAAASHGSVRVVWELLAAPGKVSKDKKGERLYYSFNILVKECVVGSYWVDPARKIDQDSLYAALASAPAPKVDPMAALRARVANDRAELAAKRAAEQAAASTPAAPAAPVSGSGLDENGDIAL